MSIFSSGEWQQYQRHVQLHGVGVTGQQRLKNARVLIVGAGGLGCPVAQYLGAAGVGHITLMDNDLITQSNLHRQVLFGYNDIGQAKAQVAANRLMANNPFIEVQATIDHLSAHKVAELVAGADIVLDCSDNFATRLLINDACVHQKRPWVYASVLGFSGQVALFTPKTACFRCVFPEIPVDVPDCNAAGVLSTVPGLLGTLQANTCLHFLLGAGEAYEGNLQLYDGTRNQFRSIALTKNKQCACCASRSPPPEGKARLKRLSHYQPQQASSQIVAEAIGSLNLNAIDLSSKDGELRPDVFVQHLTDTDNALLLDVRSESEHQGFNIGGRCIGLDADFIKAVSELCAEVNRPIFVYCQSGIRSIKAGDTLRLAGYVEVYTLQGGLGELLTQEPLIRKISAVRT
ncbi:HesA/MoeB/ThiF family protein [Paraglaciecola polaris]|uniref:Adenylyltransferase and sulfurtransferase n=1 Tax=Paraglaciecola polaris LMG 21857 TaxID=1129793 RepID=K6ZUA6_9ALTE|nr:HesA/MoeB/ThiF family protein [Paraglaciecola polaris]GAC33862.1 adenylyltransferase and sulfurtransferase [Paraglaciecola polaris LMG 21857]